MKTLISCEFNMDTACVELKYADGTMLSIDTWIFWCGGAAIPEKWKPPVRNRKPPCCLVAGASLLA